MRNTLLNLLMLLFIGCGPGLKNASVENRIDPALQPYYDRFVQAGMSEGVFTSGIPITIEFGGISEADLASGVLANCTMGQFHIRVDAKAWNSSNTTDIAKEYILFHELGHCILNREHDTSHDRAGHITSMMYPYIDIGMYQIDKSYYIHELFHPAH
jgi:hypothetical protein